MWGATPFTSRYTRCGALHPIRRGAMPTDRVQRHFQQAFSRTRNDTNYQPTHTTQALHPLRRATPDVGRCTRCGALHPMWGATPDQKRCNAYGSSAAPHATSIFADARYSPDSASAHLLPSPWTPATAGLTVTLQPQSHTAPSPAKIATVIGMLLTEQWMISVTSGNSKESWVSLTESKHTHVAKWSLVADNSNAGLYIWRACICHHGSTK